MNRQIASANPELMIVASFKTVIKAVEDAALLNLKVSLEPPCPLEESHSHVVELSPS
ncbi:MULTISPECIES: hypothetical protein [Rhizobium]|uniref:hypothetical protein n=1 Tax=Rhizobium TaxID=379 RepID=UPI0013EF31D8|nr:MULTISPECIES: hypothetical protein [Rhizobium]